MDPEQPTHLLLTRIRHEILPLFEKAITDDAVFFENPYLTGCWQRQACDKTSCPSHGRAELRCWQTAGTYCGGTVQGSFVEKYSTCLVCDVFREACPTVVEELGEHLNNMLFLMRKQKRRTTESMKRVQYLNQELATSLEALDAKNREIQELVITDKLTGLYNRHYLFTVLEDELARFARGRYRFAVLMLDVDDFKSFNDTYGHLEGDKVLARMGQVLQDSLRQADRAFRYGGEEFVVVLPDTDRVLAHVVAERIRCTFRAQELGVRPEGAPATAVSRTVSIGIAISAPGLDLHGLLARADGAMYRAKAMGKDAVAVAVEEE
ncbi:MAG: GGDEF domain-containing protein [Thermodesulfobacteriota bacterium]